MSKLKKTIKFSYNFIRCFGIFKGIDSLFSSIANKKHYKLYVNLDSYIYLRKNTTDVKVFSQVFFGNDYVISMDFEPKVIFDIGANIGCFTLKLKQKFPDAKFICVEPDVNNFFVLKNNLLQFSNVELEQKGLWKSNARLKVYDKYNMGSWGMVVEEDFFNGTIEGIGMMTLIEKYNISCIDILKIDIEGSEKFIFESGKYESWLPLVRVIIIELHDWLEIGCSKMFFKAIDRCFKVYKLEFSGENIIIRNLDF
jgi:FkbM family methyltransferase